MKPHSLFTKNFILLTSLLVVMVFFPCLLSAHGIQVQVSQQSPNVFIKASYHGSKIVAEARVSIEFQGEAERTEFLKGNTDKNGIFSFSPDKPGHWNITVDDMMGHRKTVSIDLRNEFFAPIEKKEVVKEETPESTADPVVTPHVDTQKPAPEVQFSSNSSWIYIIKILLGVLVILGITLYLSRWQKKQESQKNSEK